MTNETHDLIIEDNIPIPTRVTGGSRPRSREVLALGALEIGQSILFRHGTMPKLKGTVVRDVEQHTQMHVSNLRMRCTKYYGYKYATRAVEDGFRVWRTE